MTTVYLVRHGETIDNARRIMQGQTQGQLNENGIQQAKDLGLRLADVHFDAYVSSDLQRSIETCRLVVGSEKQALIVTTKLLRERDWGSFTGMFIPELANLNDPSKWPDDIETLEELKQRAAQFLEWLKREYPDKVVLAVGHGIINKAVQSVFYGKPMNEIAVMKNADVRILKIE